jgi:type III secretion protein J
MRMTIRPLCLMTLTVIAIGCAVPVTTGIDEGEANRVVVALDQAGIDSAKEVDPTVEGKFRVTVARDDVGRALVAMRDEELPRPKTRGLAESADRGQLVPSQAAEHAQLVAGLSGELEKTLSSIDGVLAARVHLNLPQRELLRDGPMPKATASVLVEHRGSTPPIAPDAVQRLVAGGAPGLAPADVAVVLVARPARPSGGRTDLAHVGPITVARGSSATLKIALAGLVGIVLALAASTLALWSRLARARRDKELDVQNSQRAQPPQMHPAARPVTAHGQAISVRPGAGMPPG